MADPTTDKSRRKKPPAKSSKRAESLVAGAKASTGPTGKPSAKSKPSPKSSRSGKVALDKAPAKAVKPDASGLAAELRTLRAERAQLAAELEIARARITELEAARTEAINRIDWVIDSLQSLAGKKQSK